MAFLPLATALAVDATRTARLKPLSNEPGRLVYTMRLTQARRRGGSPHFPFEEEASPLQFSLSQLARQLT